MARLKAEPAFVRDGKTVGDEEIWDEMLQLDEDEQYRHRFQSALFVARTLKADPKALAQHYDISEKDLRNAMRAGRIGV